MRAERIIAIVLIIFLIFSFSLLETEIIKVKKGEGKISLEKFEKRVRLFFNISIFFLLIFFIFLILQLRKNMKRGENESMSPIIKVFENIQLKENELKEKSETERKKAEEARLLYSTLFEHSNIGIILIDQYGRVENYNTTAKEQIFRGKSIPVFSRAEDVLPREINSILMSGKGRLSETNVGIRDKIYNISVIRSPNNKTFLLVKDITEVKKIERMLSIKKEEEKLGKMASYLAHEIKNSLGIIIGYIKLVKNNPECKKTEKALNESQKLLKMMEDYLSLSKNLHKKIEYLNLKEIIEESNLIINLELIFSPGFENIRIYFDRELLKTIFTNLLKNSKESTAKSVALSFEENSDYYYILYNDDGSGIKNEFKDKVFLPFFTTKDSGSGMGLSIVKKFLNDSEGDIELLPSEEGANFRLIFKK